MKIEKRNLFDVVIIGAGASGLQSAARLLSSTDRNGTARIAAQQPSVLILEARDRIGGRVCTITEERKKIGQHNQASFPRDLGAAWVHGIGPVGGCEDARNPMVSLLEEVTPTGKSAVDHHLHLIFPGNGWTRPDTILHKAGKIALFCDGEHIPNDSPSIAEAIKRHYAIEKEVASYATDLFESGEGMQTIYTSVKEARSLVKKRSKIDEGGDLVETLIPLYTFLNENWNGISENDLQLSSCEAPEVSMKTDEHYTNEGDFEGPHCKVKLGMEKVLEPLNLLVGQKIFLNERVSKIAYLREENKIRIESTSGLQVDTTACISTIPLGCLQHDASTLFEPPINDEAIDALESISTGVYKKVFLSFDSIFWPIEEPLLALVRSRGNKDELGQYLLAYNLWAKDSIPCLEAVLSGNLGKWAVNRSDSEIQEAVLKFIEDSMGLTNLSERCVDCHVTRWEEDPLSRGSYSSFCLGTMERHIDVFCTPHWDGRLIFAGEFTESEHMGSVHAALRSGNRAALQAAEVLQNDRKTPFGGPV